MDTSRFLKTTTSLQDYLKNKTKSGIGSGGGAGDESETEAFLVNDTDYTIYFKLEGEMTIDGKNMRMEALILFLQEKVGFTQF